MTELNMLKNDELQEINGGGTGWDLVIGYVFGKVVDYATTTMMDPNHYLGKPDYRTWYN